MNEWNTLMKDWETGYSYIFNMHGNYKIVLYAFTNEGNTIDKLNPLRIIQIK